MTESRYDKIVDTTVQTLTRFAVARDISDLLIETGSATKEEFVKDTTNDNMIKSALATGLYDGYSQALKDLMGEASASVLLSLAEDQAKNEFIRCVTDSMRAASEEPNANTRG